MPRIELGIRGLDKFRDRLRELAPKIRKEVKAEMWDFGEDVMAASKLVVPVDQGNLMNSGHVEMHPDVPSGGNPAYTFEGGEKPGPEEIVVILGYGGPAREYALYVHEELQGSVPPNPNWSWAKKVARGGSIDWTRPGSGPKYLERPLREKQGDLPKRLAGALRRAVA